MNMEKHNNYCKEVVNDLEKYASSEYFEHNGDLFRFCDLVETYNEAGEVVYTHPDINEVMDYEPEPASLWDYFTDGILDIDWIIDSNREYKAARICIAFGGPNVYINTWENKVELYWWTESGEAYIPSDLVTELDTVLGELYAC